MNKKIISSVIIVAIIALIGGSYLFYKKYFLSRIGTSAQSKSEVKIVDGIPKLFVDGKKLDTGVVQIFYFPPQGDNKGPAYGTKEWLDNMKVLIDRAVSENNRIVVLAAWWQDLDKSTNRPNNIGDNLDFGSLDAVFGYARQKGAYIMPEVTIWPFTPDWWLRENNFPPYNQGKTCDFCETDSLENVYSNPSMNSDKVHEDYGAFIEALVKHYKNNPALAAWETGVGDTGEDNYGPNYIALLNPSNINSNNLKKGSTMYTDFSPYFQRKFKDWLEKKYKNDQGLESAWNDKSATFNSFKMPKPEEMIQSGKKVPDRFPDPAGTDAIFLLATGNGKTDLSMLTQKGLDFYDFRNYMRQKDRQFYSDLIKKNDPDHILVMDGTSSEFLDQVSQQSLADGIFWNLPVPSKNGDEGLLYYLATDVVRRTIEHGKLPIIPEDGFGCNNGSNTSQCETPDKLNFVEAVGKAIKCNGGMFAPTFGPYDKDYIIGKKGWVPPIWYSDQMLTVASNISSYRPSQDCACSLTVDYMKKFNCDKNTQSFLPDANGFSSCEFLNRARLSLCSSNNNSDPNKINNNNFPPPPQNQSGPSNITPPRP